MKEQEKIPPKEYINKSTGKSMSEFVRDTTAKKIKPQDLVSSNQISEPFEILDYIPKNQYVVFVKGVIVAAGSTPSDLSEIALQQFPYFPFIIKYNGPTQKSMEYCDVS